VACIVQDIGLDDEGGAASFARLLLMGLLLEVSFLQLTSLAVA
jgi:hypothetical protein